MNNEPVAWQGLTADEIATIPNDEFRLQTVERILKKRNTHPAELTDEEIKQIFLEQTGFYFDDNPADDLALMDFARAILRKVQEK